LIKHDPIHHHPNFSLLPLIHCALLKSGWLKSVLRSYPGTEEETRRNDGETALRHNKEEEEEQAAEEGDN